MRKHILLFVCLFGLVGEGFSQSTGTNCEERLLQANKYYSIPNYEKAAKMYKQVMDAGCGATYGGAQKRYNECVKKVEETQEAAAYKACMESGTIAACREYLAQYPNGPHATTVRNKLNNLLKEWEELKEEQKEQRLYNQCTTIAGCDNYLASYPNGKYATLVRQKREELEAEALRKIRFREEAEKTGYMKNIRVLFQNADDVEGNSIIEGPGNEFYASELKFLSPLLYYDGILDDETQVALLYTRIFDPNGQLMQADNSPYAFTNYSGTFVFVGDDHTSTLSGFGSYRPGTFGAGYYIYEIWYESEQVGLNMLYSTTFSVVDKTTSISSYSWNSLLGHCFEVTTEVSETDAYKGFISAGRKSRMGACQWVSGSYYFGNWSSGLMNGQGVYIASDYETVENCPGCKYYVGEWAQGIKSGEGSCYDASGKLIYYGNFDNDAPTDAYPMTGYYDYRFICYPMGDGSYYFGEVQNDIPEGKGMQIWTNGELWYGDWEGGKKDGMGVALPYRGEPVIERWSEGIKR